MSNRCLLFVLLVAVPGSVVMAGGIKLPPIIGDLRGDFRPFEMSSAPNLHWSSALRPAGDVHDGRVMETKIEGEGTRLRGLINLATTEDGTWQILEGEIDLAAWFPIVAEKVGEAMKGLGAKGMIILKGNGLVRAGAPSGVVLMTVREGRLGNAEGGWALEGIALTAEFLIEAEGIKVKSTTPFELAVAKISTTRFGAENLLIHGVLNEDHTIALSDARIDIAGGEITLDPTMLTLSPLGLEATMQIVNVGLQDIAALIPRSFASAQGRIDGTVRMGWALTGGFRVGAGNLTLGKSEQAIVTLAPAPGFLTQTMPKRFEPVPSWTGPLSKWLSADNPAYTDMAAIELGEAPLQVDSLTVKLTPEGDEFGKTATVRMRARPTKPGASVGVVNIDVNVVGPLDSIMKLGLNREFSINAHR
ncbi:MAG: YdbH domain-containing protein [Opitutaceae bacterium]